MLYMICYDLKGEEVTNYQAWLKKNAGKLAKRAPSGWKYRGTYFFVAGFGPHSCADLWEIVNNAAFDAWHAHRDPVFLKLQAESERFVADRPSTGFLLREAQEFG
jgi:hypothetical protein